MARTNVVLPPMLQTHEGGRAAPSSPLAQLQRLALTCLLWEPNFYATGDQTAQQMQQLAAKVKPEELARLAVQARTEMHLRHTPLFLARELARRTDGRPLVADTLERILLRADEPGEFLALYAEGQPRRPLAASVRRGVARALRRFDAYQLAKYNRAGRYPLRLVFRLTHPRPTTPEQAALWGRVVRDELPTPDTWEVALSAGGDKRAAWERLLSERKLGGLALLRNLRNMEQAGVPAPVIREALAAASFHRVLPFRFLAAARAAPRLEDALEEPMLRAARDLPRLTGKTLMLVDVSGSMSAALSAKSDLTRLDAASALAILLREVCERAEIWTFDSRVALVPPRRGFALRDAIGTPRGATHLGEAVAHANLQGYDRIVVLTDEQSSDRVGAPLPGRPAYMINVAPYAQGVNFGAWTGINGFSEQVLTFIHALETQTPA